MAEAKGTAQASVGTFMVDLSAGAGIGVSPQMMVTRVVAGSTAQKQGRHVGDLAAFKTELQKSRAEGKKECVVTFTRPSDVKIRFHQRKSLLKQQQHEEKLRQQKEHNKGRQQQQVALSKHHIDEEDNPIVAGLRKIENPVVLVDDLIMGTLSTTGVLPPATVTLNSSAEAGWLGREVDGAFASALGPKVHSRLSALVFGSESSGNSPQSRSQREKEDDVGCAVWPSRGGMSTGASEFELVLDDEDEDDDEEKGGDGNRDQKSQGGGREGQPVGFFTSMLATALNKDPTTRMPLPPPEAPPTPPPRAGGDDHDHDENSGNHDGASSSGVGGGRVRKSAALRGRGLPPPPPKGYYAHREEELGVVVDATMIAMADAEEEGFVEVEFSLLRPMGMRLTGPSSSSSSTNTPSSSSNSFVVVKGMVASSDSPARDLGVRQGWRVVKVGRDPVSSLEDFVSAVNRRRGRGDGEATVLFDPSTALENNWSAKEAKTSAAAKREAKHVAGAIRDVVAVPGQQKAGRNQGQVKERAQGESSDVEGLSLAV